MGKYVVAHLAETDLTEIWDYIAQDSIGAADRWIDRLEAAFTLLAETPGLGHRRNDWTSLPVLFWPVAAYVIVYRVHAERIEIVAVTQGSRDIPSFLKGREL